MAMGIIDGHIIGGTDEGTVADQYNESRNWKPGEYCLYNSTLYKCTSDTTGTFDFGAWAACSCGLELSKLNSNLIANGESGATNFYFDFKDGEYGWNSDVNRGADTFHPFRASGGAKMSYRFITSGTDPIYLTIFKGDAQVAYLTNWSGSQYTNTYNDEYIGASWDNTLRVWKIVGKRKMSVNGIDYKYGDSILTISGSKEVDILIKAEEVYLYKDGKQVVAWDNENYSLFSTYPKFSKEFKFNAEAMVATVQSTNDKSIDIGTNNIVELGDYHNICFEIMYGNKSVISRVDISSVNSGYVSASVWTNSNKGFIRLHVSSTKSNVGEGSLALLAVENGTLAVGTIVSITRVWLE